MHSGVTIEISDETTARQLAAYACLIAVLRSDGPIPVPPAITFDKVSDDDDSAPETPAPPPPPVAATVTPPPPPASESLLISEAARVAAAPLPPPPASAGETDVHGVPWDERIHSSTKVKNADGSWRTRRGADPALVAQITAELKGHAESLADPTVGGQPAGAPVPPLPPPAGPSDADTAFGAGGAAPASDVPPPPPAPPADVPPPPAPPADPAGINYPAIIARANALDKDYDSLNAMGKMFGLEKFSDLAKRPDLFEAFMAALG